MKAIGGYFELEQLISNEYYKNLISLNSGRNALLYLLKARKIKKLYIPYYLCDSVRDILKKNNYIYEYYNVDSEFMPIFNGQPNENELIYIVNYYGQLTNAKIKKIYQQYKHIILDNTHAFFQRPLDGIDTIYSCRKFFGVPDGAYLSTNVRLNESLDHDTSKERMSHILGRYEGNASDYYNEFQSSEDSLKGEYLKNMSKLTHNILGAIDYKQVYYTRNKNFSFIHSKLKEHNRLKLISPDGAFAYPFFIENGTEIRKELVKKNIYIPTLWPNVKTDTLEGSIEYNFAINILPLPCDQRYGIEEMQFLVEEVRKCIN